MLAASINYPMRGAAVWKSVVGTNVASDALSNLASAGVKGGAVIIIGEDYGEGASIIQERSHAAAMKSSIWLMDPRPDHERFVALIEKAFELSEASNSPVMMEFRIRACHVHGRFRTRNNRAPAVSRNHPLENPEFDLGRICLPPVTYAQEKHKIEHRFPAAIDFIRAQNSTRASQAGTTRSASSAKAASTTASCARCNNSASPMPSAWPRCRSSASTSPTRWCRTRSSQFCAGKRAVLMVEEGNPDYLEQAVNALLRKSDLNTTIVGKGVLPMAGEYTAEVMLRGVAGFLEGAVPQGIDLVAIGRVTAAIEGWKKKAADLIGAPVPKRPPGFCVGCPERPVFSAIKLVERDFGKIHVAADVGCHGFSTLPPFNIGNSILGYGLGLASAAGVSPAFSKRVISVMGDGGFWHNGLSTGISGAADNHQDGVLLIMANGYSSATGQQYLPSSTVGGQRRPTASIEKAVRAMGVNWVHTVRTYSVGKMVKRLQRGADLPGPRPQGDHRRRRMPIGAPAAHPPAHSQGAGGGRARHPHALRRRRDDLHRRPFLHPALGLSIAHHQGQSRSAAARPGGACQQRLRRLRLVRRGRRCRRALPFLLPGGHRAESECLGPAAASSAQFRHRLAAAPRGSARRGGGVNSQR